MDTYITFRCGDRRIHVARSDGVISMRDDSDNPIPTVVEQAVLWAMGTGRDDVFIPGFNKHIQLLTLRKN